MRATVILTAPRAPHSHDLAVAAELVATTAIAIMRASAAQASRDFWRTRMNDSARAAHAITIGIVGRVL